MASAGELTTLYTKAFREKLPTSTTCSDDDDDQQVMTKVNDEKMQPWGPRHDDCSFQRWRFAHHQGSKNRTITPSDPLRTCAGHGPFSLPPNTLTLSLFT